MPDEQRRYLAYLLRLWQVQRNGKLVWSASLEDAHSGERHGFAELDLLVKFLKQKFNIEQDDSKNPRSK